MKKFSYIIHCIFLTLIIISCDELKSNETSHTEVKEKVYNGVKKNYLKGKLASTITYKDSLKNGSAINYYPSGKVNMEFNYKNNVKDGPYKWYFENGKTYIEGQYKEGKKEGLFKMYRDNGTLKAEMPWHEDQPCVGLKEYFESGNPKPIPKIVVNHRNTIKLNNKYEIDISLSDKSEYVKFYEGYLGEKESFPDYFAELPHKKGKATLTLFLAKGELVMKTITIIAKIRTKDKDFYILKKNINISAENRG